MRGAVLSLVFLEDGKHFLSGGEDKMIRQWSVEDGREIGPPFRMNSDIWALALSNDRNWIISGEANAVATVWSRKTRQSALTVNAHLDKVYTVDVSPDSTKFATGSRDFRAFIWDLATGRRLVGPLHHDYWVVSVRFSPDGNRIATTTSLHTSIRVYNVHNAECLADISVLSSARNTIAWSRDSQFIFALSSDALSRIHIDSGALRSKWTVPGETLSMTGSVALSSNGGFIASYVGSSLTLWDTWTRRRLGPVLDHPTGPLRSITLSLDDKYVAAGSQNGTITIHNLDNIKPTTSHPVISQRDAQQRETGTHGAAPEQQIEALRDALHALEIRFGTFFGNSLFIGTERYSVSDALTRTTTLMNDRLQALQATPPRVPYGTYRIKTNTSDVYLTCPQGVPGTVVVQPFDKSSVSQRVSCQLLCPSQWP